METEPAPPGKLAGMSTALELLIGGGGTVVALLGVLLPVFRAQGKNRRREIDSQGENLRAAITAQGENLRDAITAQGDSLRRELDTLRGDLRADVASLRADVGEVRRDLRNLGERVARIEAVALVTPAPARAGEMPSGPGVAASLVEPVRGPETAATQPPGSR